MAVRDAADEIRRLRAINRELLAALKHVREWLLEFGPIAEGEREFWNPKFVKANDMTNAAIAKAEGR